MTAVIGVLEPASGCWLNDVIEDRCRDLLFLAGSVQCDNTLKCPVLCHVYPILGPFSHHTHHYHSFHDHWHRAGHFGDGHVRRWHRRCCLLKTRRFCYWHRCLCHCWLLPNASTVAAVSNNFLCEDRSVGADNKSMLRPASDLRTATICYYGWKY